MDVSVSGNFPSTMVESPTLAMNILSFRAMQTEAVVPDVLRFQDSMVRKKHDVMASIAITVTSTQKWD